jgi:quinol monooxygenase YgiN
MIPRFARTWTSCIKNQDIKNKKNKKSSFNVSYNRLGIIFAQQKSTETKSEPMKKTVVARLTIKKEAVDTLMQFAKKIVDETRKETGCKSYALYKNCVGQDSDFLFYEEYKDQASLDFHNNSEHLKQFFSNITPLIEGKPMVEVF